ncbi:hypothetical protein ABZ733_15470 [Streptomyces longwoodensis]|uniref:hypothetical protein n=1 Tax=Streptomyces longwoodensis TaxID=68231 RepID=UPI0033C559FC
MPEPLGVAHRDDPQTAPGAQAAVAAGGGADALRGSVPEHTLRSVFAAGLDTALVTAGCVGVVAGALVLVLVRTPAARPAGVTEPGAGTLEEGAAASRR